MAKTTDIVPAGEFAIADFSDIQKKILQNYGGDMSVIELPRAKVAAGGSPHFELPDEVGELTTAKVIRGVILIGHVQNSYWKSKDLTNEAPDCFSIDGITGYNPSTGERPACASCPLNVFGTGTDRQGNPTKGKACKNGYRIYILREGETFPLILNIPPTSVRQYMKKQFAIFENNRRPYHSMVVSLTVVPITTGGNTYGTVRLNANVDDNGKAVWLDDKTVAALGEYAEFIKSSMMRAYDEPPVVEDTPDDDLVAAAKNGKFAKGGKAYEEIDAECETLEE